MTISTPHQPSHPSFSKMEDRKRSAGDDLAPPTKRQAVNGKSSADSDMPWAADLEKYQKDAIYRQMLEYKREKNTREAELKAAQKAAVDHDDHIRVALAWWSQLLDEVKLLAEDIVPSADDLDVIFPTALNFKGSEEFQSYLASKGKEIKSKIQIIFTNLAATRGKPGPEAQELQKQLTKLLASQKEHAVKFDRLEKEKIEVSQRLETASLRYIKAEKKLDRAKSSAVAKMEQQAIASGGSTIGSAQENGDIEMINGISEESEASHTAYKEATVVLEKQKEQLEAINAENKTLTEQLTAATARLASLTEDDYARTELFKQFRSQHEDVIRRINHLEATNIQLREEAEKYQAERTAYRTQVENDADALTSELQDQLQRLEADLTRVRHNRDELATELSMRKAGQDQERASTDVLQELIASKEDRIKALESEVERIRLAHDGACEPTPSSEIVSLGLEELRTKYKDLEQQFQSINQEMPSMQAAYKRAQAAASKKVADFSALEEKIQILQAEKTKADQKYFAARKDMDMRIQEVRTLRTETIKSSEVISQLKDVESANRALLSNLEKQLSDIKHANTTTASAHKKLESQSKEATNKVDSLTKQVVELQNQLKSKDSDHASTKERIQVVEADLERLRVRYEQAQKDRDAWKVKSLSNQSGEEEMLRAFALCTICRKDFKNTTIKTCGHTFCNNCVDDRIANRMRKCPNCSKAFDKSDVMTIHM